VLFFLEGFGHGFCCVWVRIIELRLLHGARFLEHACEEPISCLLGIEKHFLLLNRPLSHAVNTPLQARKAEPETELFFARLIQRVVPKSDKQALAEVHTTRKWFEYIRGDQVRMVARSFGVPGDHAERVLVPFVST
jgi:hypothetical protein